MCLFLKVFLKLIKLAYLSFCCFGWSDGRCCYYGNAFANPGCNSAWLIRKIAVPHQMDVIGKLVYFSFILGTHGTNFIYKINTFSGSFFAITSSKKVLFLLLIGFSNDDFSLLVGYLHYVANFKAQISQPLSLDVAFRIELVVVRASNTIVGYFEFFGFHL